KPTALESRLASRTDFLVDLPRLVRPGAWSTHHSRHQVPGCLIRGACLTARGHSPEVEPVVSMLRWEPTFQNLALGLVSHALWRASRPMFCVVPQRLP